MRYQFTQEEIPLLHVTGKCHLPMWPHGMAPAWKIFSKCLRELQKDYSLKIHAFTLMSNHYHLICTYDIKSDPHLFEWFHELIGFNYLHTFYEEDYILTGEPPGIYPVENPKYYQVLYRYIYRNPVEAGLVKKAEAYKYSTLSHLLHGKKLRFKCHDEMNLITDPIRILKWVNDQESYGFVN